MFSRKEPRTEKDVELEKKIKDMDISWREIFTMIIAFYQAILPYVLILLGIMLGLYFLSMYFLTR
jgi:type II secretory pathway component PulF